ncbi:hypothetical protein GGS24DRAFT_6540 [Hypoxylon argillaceum]|nr:hypothetical protein GGS24DRAFT_6540 [Hypoxylon argillaceum]
MDTINNMAASAAKAVWGENKSSTEEPVSGRLGDTSKGEPYDAGNIESGNANTSNETSTNGVANGDVNGDATKDAKFAKTTGTAAGSTDIPQTPSTGLKESSGAGDSSKGQNDTRSPEDPKTHPEKAPTDVNDADEEGVNEAPDVEGPGPKPLSEVAKEHGGDAGNDSKSSVDTTDKSNDATDESKEESKEESHESKGTGEKYVKTTGLQADGGDFDATKPGAGREADRLMEEKGMHNPADPSSGGDNGGSSSPTSGKKSLGQKIKDKLHRH